MSVPSLTYYALIPHADHRAILLQASDSGWTLPHITTDDWNQISVAHLSDQVRSGIGFDATALRRILVHRKGDELLRTVLLMENHTPRAEPRGEVRWITEDEIAFIPDPLLQEAAHRWFNESPADPPLRTPWAKPGWFAQSRAWVEDQAQKAGYSLTAPLYMRRTWSLTCMLIQPTDQGDLYIKATNAMFGPEAELTALLGQWFPGYFPDVVAYDGSHL